VTDPDRNKVEASAGDGLTSSVELFMTETRQNGLNIGATCCEFLLKKTARFYKRERRVQLIH